MRMAQIAEHDPAAKVLLRPWSTAQTTVLPRAVGSQRDGTESVGLDIMPWADDFPVAFEGLAGQARVDRAVELAIPLISGLDHIHQHHPVVHRDIHPSNVMYAGDRLVLVDWGIASAVTDGTSTFTAPMGKKGPYLAPETANGQRIGRFTDAWALGVLLCEMACGEPLVQVDAGGAVRLPRSAEDLPAWLRGLITGLTTFDRGERMPLKDAVSALRAAGQGATEAEFEGGAVPSTAITAPAATTAPNVLGGGALAHRRARAKELFVEGYEHSSAGRSRKALAAYATAVHTCDGDADPVLRLHMAMALNNIQWTLRQLGQHSEAVANCSRVVDTFSLDADPLIRQQVAIAINDRGHTNRALSLDESAVADWDEVVTRFGGDPDLVLRRHVALALRDKGVALAKLDRRVDALSAYTRLIESFDDDPDPVLRQQVALALNNKRSCLYRLGHHAEALAACTRLVDVFGGDRDLVIRQQVATALHSKGLILERSRQREGALAAYGRLADSFSNDPDPYVQMSVKWALGRLGAES